MTNKEYNGWHNYETWVVNLWFDNEEGTYNYWRETALELVKEDNGDPVSQLADAMRDMIEENNPTTDANVYADLMNAAISEVNWREIASHHIDAAIETLAEENEDEFIEAFGDAIGLQIDGATAQWKAFAAEQNLTREARLQIVAGGADSGTEQGEAFLELHPKQNAETD